MAGAAASAPEAGSGSPRWVPIDALLATAAGDLRSGELVHVAGFSLFHSMNALQIMDPKMDVGVNAASLRTARELVSLGRAPLDLSDEDATYVFDALLACEATWHRGQALATTVHTCLYVHDRERLEAAPSLVVRAYLEATRSAVATVRHAVQCGDIYEEEDFVISANGFDVGEPASADVGGDDGAARRANDVGPAASSAATKDAALAGLRAVEAWLVENAGVVDRTGALLARVRFRVALHVAHARLLGAASNDAVAAVAAAADASRATLEAEKHLAKMRATMTEAREPTDASSRAAFGGGVLDWDPDGLGFDRRVNLTALGPAPPRVVTLHSRAGAMDHFARHLKELRRVCDLVADLRGGDARARAQEVSRGEKNKNKNKNKNKTVSAPPSARRGLNEILGALGAMSATDPTVVPRSYAALAVCTPGGGLLGKHHGDAALRSAWVAGTVPPPAVDLDAALRGDASRDGEGGPAGTDAWDERLGAGTPSVVGDFDFDFDFDCDVSENASTPRDEGSSARGGRDDGPSKNPPSFSDAKGTSEAAIAAARSVASRVAEATGRSDAADATRDFLSGSARASELIVRAYLSNRSRCRRKLRRLLAEWSDLADLGYAADASGFVPAHLAASASAGAKALASTAWAARAFGGWAEATAARAQLAHLVLGHALELYLPHELCVVYWYQEYLTQTLQDIMRVAEDGLSREAAAEVEEEEEEEKGSRKGGARKGGAKKGARSEKDGDGGRSSDRRVSLVRVKLEGAFLELQKTMCKGLVRLAAALERLGRIPTPTRDNPRTDPEQTFWQRFGAFHACRRPPPLSFADFAAYVAPDTPAGGGADSNPGVVVTPETLLDAAGKCFELAKAQARGLRAGLPPGTVSDAQAEDLEATARAAAANAAAAKLALAPGWRASFEHKHHPAFASVLLKRE